MYRPLNKGIDIAAKIWLNTHRYGDLPIDYRLNICHITHVNPTSKDSKDAFR